MKKKSDGKHVVSWGVDSLDRIMDSLDIYEGMCVRCYDKEHYVTSGDLTKNYVPIISSEEFAHRKLIESLSYLGKADGLDVLVRDLRQNKPENFELLFKRKIDQYIVVGVGADAYENVTFMSQIELPDGKLVSYPTMVFGMVGNVDSETERVEHVYDYMRKNLIHDTGDHDAAANLFRPYTVTPYSPELGWILEVGEAGSPSSSAAITGAFRAIGLPAEQFPSPISKFRAGSVEADGKIYYYNGNDFLGSTATNFPLCVFFRTLEQVDNYTGIRIATSDASLYT